MTESNGTKDTDEQRRRALEATLMLVTRQGYHATTLAAVAKESEVSESFILWHFRNKDRLFAEALDFSYLRRRANSPTWSEMVAPADRLSALRDNLDGLSEPTTAGTEYRTFGLMLGLETRPVEASARKRFVEYRGRTVTSIEDWWDRCLQISDAHLRRSAAELLARLTISAVDGRFVNAVETQFDRVTTTAIMATGLEAVARSLERDPVPALTVPTLSTAGHLPSPAPSSQDESSTRVQILRAAARTAAETGIDGTKISRICRESGCSPTSIYWFFRDKQAIFESLIGFLADDWNETHPARSSSSQWESDPLRSMVSHSLWRYEGAPSLMRISLMLLLHGREAHTSTREECLRVRDEVRREWVEGFASAFPHLAERGDESLLRSIAFVHASMLDGLFMSHQISGDDRSLVGYADVLTEMMRAGVEAQLPDASTAPTR